VLPFFIAESLMVEADQKPARMSGNKVIDVFGVTVNVTAEIINLDIGMAVLLRESRHRQ
jgi:hypothetical protein